MLFSFIVIRSQLPIFRKATSSGLKTILIFVLVLNFHAKNGDVWQNFPSVVMLLLWVRSPTECVRVMASYAGTRGEVVTKAPWTDQQTVSPGWAERVRCTDSSAREWRHSSNKNWAKYSTRPQQLLWVENSVASSLGSGESSYPRLALFHKMTQLCGTTHQSVTSSVKYLIWITLNSD